MNRNRPCLSGIPVPGRIGPIAALLGALVMLAGCRKATPEQAVVPPKVVGDQVQFPANSPQLSAIGVDPVQPRHSTVTSFTGRLVWDENVTVRVFSPVAGRVKETPISLGQNIAVGDLLARIDSPDFGQTQADVRKATADLTFADRSLTRLRDLLAHGAAPRKDVENAEDAYNNAVSEKERALARLALYGGTADVVDGLYALKAPLGGVVVERNINPGQEVRPDQMLANAPQLFAPLFIISDPKRLWVWLDVTELDMAGLKPNQEIRIYTKAYPDRSFPGRLEIIGDSLDPTTRAVKARGALANPDKLLKAEMYVTVEVVSPATGGVDISANAIFPIENQYYVFVENSPGQYERRAVKVGPESEGKFAVLEGLQAGQRVVTKGCLLLQQILESGDKT